MRYLSGRNAHTQPVHGRFLLPLVHLQGERRAQRFKNPAWPHLSTPHCTCNPQRGAWRSPRRRPLTLVSCLSSRMSVWPPPLRIRCRSRATSSSSSPIGVSLVLRDLGGEQGGEQPVTPLYTSRDPPKSHITPSTATHPWGSMQSWLPSTPWLRDPFLDFKPTQLSNWFQSFTSSAISDTPLDKLVNDRCSSVAWETVYCFLIQ